MTRVSISVHMPGHIYYRMGDYARAEQAFNASMQVDELYMQQQHVQPDNDWNYVHNLMYSVANLLEEGKLKQATALSAKLTRARGELESTLYVYSARDSISRLDPGLPVALRMADWSAVTERLNANTPPARHPNLDFLARQLASFAAGMRAVETHNVSQAEAASARFDAGLWRMSSQKELPGMPTMQMIPVPKAPAGRPAKLQVMPDALLQPLLSTLSIMSLELRASILLAERNTEEAKALFGKAAREEKALGYHEPPSYIRPVAETEGAAMMAIGDWTNARTAYEQALRECPRSGLALYGIAMSSVQSGHPQAAVKEYADFLAAWKDADRSLAQIAQATTYLADHPAHSTSIPTQ